MLCEDAFRDVQTHVEVHEWMCMGGWGRGGIMDHEDPNAPPLVTDLNRRLAMVIQLTGGGAQAFRKSDKKISRLDVRGLHHSKDMLD